jgi:hypothetical protein
MWDLRVTDHMKFIWLVVYLPLWKIWKSNGIIVPNIWKVKNSGSKPPTSHMFSEKIHCYREPPGHRSDDPSGLFSPREPRVGPRSLYCWDPPGAMCPDTGGRFVNWNVFGDENIGIMIHNMVTITNYVAILWIPLFVMLHNIGNLGINGFILCNRNK